MIKIVSSNNLRGYINSPYLLISPLLQPLDGQKLVKVSGTVGDVDSEWRESPSDLQRITRTLDAFQHFVMMRTQGKLLISDLQGIYIHIILNSWFINHCLKACSKLLDITIERIAFLF